MNIHHSIFFFLVLQSLIENTFKSFEIKSISDTNNITTEIISNLEPDTKYIVGVLLITNDGNFNDQDVVYGQYKTPCIRKYILNINIVFL